ncbi:MAG TPA: hypothetical protein VII01_08180 [Solirubrobacteraceae bacterium]
MAARPNTARTLAAILAALLLIELLLAPAASASRGNSPLPVALFGIPSLHSIIQAIANGFFSALAGALVPSWLKHGTVATIQHLVALPDPAEWAHVSRLQGDMSYLAVMLLPVTLAVTATRYWLIGLTGAAHPASALVRCTGVTGVLVAYRWVVEQTVAAANIVSHGVLGLPTVAGGLQRIIGVLFGGALLAGAGGVFGAFLVIVGVVFAAGLFAAQVLLTVVLAVLIVAGPPLLVLSAIPELSHLARNWAYALLAVVLVPVGWTVLFATAGALCLDATSFTGAGGGLPGHVAAAFAGLITFVIAARLPLVVIAQVGQLFSGPGAASRSGTATASRMPGSERVRAAHSRLRAIGLDGIPSLGRSAGRAAGALGAPQGGPLGAARRGLATAARRSPIPARMGAAAGAAAGLRADTASGRGMRGRLTHAKSILANAPREAIAAVNTSARTAKRGQARPVTAEGQRPGGARPNRSPAARSAAKTAPAATQARETDTTPGSAAAGATVGRTRPTVTPVRAAGATFVAGTGQQAPERAGAPGGDASRGAGTSPSPPRPPEMHAIGEPAATTRAAAKAPARHAAADANTRPGGQARSTAAPANGPRPAPTPHTRIRQLRRPRKHRPKPGSRP